MKRRRRGPWMRPLRGRPGTGFTLVEILVAMVVAAVALLAMVTGSARYAADASRMREMTVGLWVAHNRLTEIGLEPAWPELGTSDGTVEMAGIEWRWDMAVVETPDPRVRRVDVRVRATQHEASAAELSAFVADRGT